MSAWVNQPGGRESDAFDPPFRQGRDGTWKKRLAAFFAEPEPVFFWIKSSAKRAFGGCLGSKRR